MAVCSPYAVTIWPKYIAPPMKTLSKNKISEKTQNEKTGAPLTVLKDSQHIAHGQLDISPRGADILCKLRTNVLSLFVIEPLDVFREVWDYEEPDKRNNTGEDAFNDEDPSPAVVASESSHFSKTTGEQTTKGAC